MRQFSVVAVLCLLAGVIAPARQATPQRDAVGPLLTAVQTAIATNSVEAFRALTSLELSANDSQSFITALLHGGVTSATLRERDRHSTTSGTRVLAEMLINRGGAGEISAWQIGLTPSEGGGMRITDLHQVSSVTGLHRLELDTTTEFAVNNFLFTATDFRLSMSTGTAFVARTADGVTALVLRGKGQMHFEPADPVERHQLKRFARTETMNENVSAAFLRINPSEYQTRISDGSLRPMTVANSDAGRARTIFNQWAGKSYNIALGDLSTERWTLLPPPGDALADMQTGRFNWLTYSRTSDEHEDVALFDRERRKNISIYASPSKIATRGRFYNEDDDRVYDVQHYDVSVRFMPQRSLVNGAATVRLRVLHHDTDTITLKLAEGLTISSLTSPGYGRLLTLRAIGQDSVIVSFPEPQPVGKILTLAMTYAGRVAPQELSRDAVEVAPQEWMPAQENKLEKEPNYAYSTGSFWYPQSTVTDYATAIMRITIPQELQAVGSGTFVGETVVGQERVATFNAEKPIRYLTTVLSRLVTTPSSRFTAPSGQTITVEGRSNPRQFGAMNTLTSRSADIMKFYASILGEVPFPSFTAVSIESDVPGGHSPAYFAAVNEPIPTTGLSWRNDPVAFDNMFPNYFLAHEIAHQWWGQSVGTKNYHEQWISEGLAQYFAYLWAGVDRGPVVQRNIYERIRLSVQRFDDSGPISLGYRLGHAVGDGTNFRAIVYNKPVIVLDMLRRLIGEEAFLAGLKRFYREQQFQKAGAEDLRLAFEAEAKQPLTRFFERWVYNSGSPTLKLSPIVDVSGQSVLLRVEQTGDLFDLPVTVSIGYQDQATEFVTVLVRGALTEVRVPLHGRVRPDSIRLVPGL